MAVRLIDGNVLKQWCEKIIDQACHPATVQIGEAFLDKVRSMPTLTPPNEWVSRVQELDELYTKLQIVTGFTAEQLLEMFAAGYTLEKPDYSKHFEAMANLAESDPPNEPLTLEQLREMDGEPVWVERENAWGIVEIQEGKPFIFGTNFECGYSPHWNIYRRPPEEEA